MPRYERPFSPREGIRHFDRLSCTSNNALLTDISVS